MTNEWLPSMSSDDRVIEIEAAVEDVFAVHAVRPSSGDVVVLQGQYLRSPELVFEAVSDRFGEMGYLPVLGKEGDADLLYAYPAPPLAGPSRPWINVALLGATIVTTLMAGAFQALPATAQLSSIADLMHGLRAGVPFTIALLSILGIHELGHYFAARRYGMDVTLPYFIPMPNMLTGTMGAVIRIRSPFASRRSLFDVGIAGPLAGLVVAIPVVALGLRAAEFVPVPPDVSELLVFHEPLLFQWMARFITGPRPEGYDLAMNPLLAAGWWGFLLTAINLLPTSQLDGGHVSYSLFGHRHRYVAWGAVVLLVVAGIYGRNLMYLVMAGLVLFIGVNHPPALNDLTPIGARRRVLGFATFALLLLLVTPDPFGGAF